MLPEHFRKTPSLVTTSSQLGTYMDTIGNTPYKKKVFELKCEFETNLFQNAQYALLFRPDVGPTEQYRSSRVLSIMIQYQLDERRAMRG